MAIWLDCAVPSTTPSRETFAVGLVVLGVVAFSVNAGVSRMVLDAGVSPAALSGVRSVGSALLLAAVVLLFRRGHWRIPRRDWGVLTVYGIVGLSLMPLLYFEAISRIPIGLALLLEYLAPLWVALWARFVRGQVVNRLLWPALALTFVGLGIVAGAGLEGLDPIGILAGLACSVAFAIYFILGERMVERSDPIVITFWGFGISSAVWAAVGLSGATTAFWQVSAATSVPLPEALGGAAVPLSVLLLWVVALGTVVPFGAETAAMKFIPATTVSVLSTAEPIGSAIVAWWLFGEVLSVGQVLGGLVVIAGIVLALLSRPGHRLPAAIE